MTEMQVKYQANQIQEEKNRIEAEKLAETIRATKLKEYLTDRENLAKYGYTAYQPITDEGYYAKSNSQGVWNTAGGALDDTLGRLLGYLGNFGKAMKYL